MHSSDGGYLATAASKIVSKTLRHFDQDERQTDGSRHWDTNRKVLMKPFEEGTRDFDEGYWLSQVHQVQQNPKSFPWMQD